jgi:uncharacterized membrane-anchored protein
VIPPWSNQILTDIVSLPNQHDEKGSTGFCEELQSSSEEAGERLERMLVQQHVAGHHQCLKLVLHMRRALENGELEAYEAYGKVLARLMAENRRTSQALLHRADRAELARRGKRAGQPERVPCPPGKMKISPRK